MRELKKLDKVKMGEDADASFYDPVTKQVAMFSLPRDTVDVPIPQGPARQVWGRSYGGLVQWQLPVVTSRADVRNEARKVVDLVAEMIARPTFPDEACEVAVQLALEARSRTSFWGSLLFYPPSIAKERVKRAEAAELIDFLKSKHVAILDDIRNTNDLTDATAAKLKAAVDGYAKTFA